MNLIKITFYFSLLFWLSTIVISCNLFSKKDDTKDIVVNANFEMTPPIAEEVFIKKIVGEDNYILLIARFPKSQLKEKFLAFNYDSTKLVMRDDGKGYDEKEADSLYTVRINTDLKDLINTLSEQSKKTGFAKHFIFKGRSIIKDSVRQGFNIEKFIDGSMVPITDIFPPPAPASLKDHSLMITDLNVVEDPTRTFNFCTQTGNIDGPWTFKTLIKNLATPYPGAVVTDVQLSDFVEHWFANWIGSPIVNGEVINSKSGVAIGTLQSWKNKSQVLPLPRVPVGKLDMRAVPFKLTAIVNRLDLRGNSGYGFSNAGEARLVFCMMSPNGCSEIPFNVIFEYGVPKNNCTAIKTYAQQWYDLNSLLFSDPMYNIKLQQITDQFTLCGTSPLKPNQNSINQVRSNELAFDLLPWELREFKLDNTTHFLQPSVVKQEPAVKYNAKLNNIDVQLLATYINSNQFAIEANNYTVPLAIGSVNFLGGKAHTGLQSALPPILPIGMPTGIAPHHWDGTSTMGSGFINSDNARQVFSLGTCSGCHSGETQTAFTMINPVPFGTQATLSGFLTGTAGIGTAGVNPVDLDGPTNSIMNVPDPAGRASLNSLRRFNDLQRRADDLQSFVTTSCRSIFNIRDILLRKPLQFVH